MSVASRFRRNRTKSTIAALACAGLLVAGTGCQAFGGLGGLLGGGPQIGGVPGFILGLISNIKIVNPLDTEIVASFQPQARNGVIFDQPLDRSIVCTAIGAFDSAPGTGTAGPDGKIYITERATGQVRKFDPVAKTFDPTAVIDLAVNSSGQRGLIGVCFAVDGSQMFVTYCASTTAGDTTTEPEGLELRVSSFPFAAGAVTGAETVLRSAPCRDSVLVSDKNSIGPCAIGPDGKLYWSCGDLDARLPAQNPFANDFAGKINRINTDGTIPGDNPFGSGYVTWALGLRDPRSFTFDAENGKFWVTDIGSIQGDEINTGTAGANYGWPWIQGLDQTDPEGILTTIAFGLYTQPQVDFGYSRVTPVGIAVIRNTTYGDGLNGDLFVGQAAAQAGVVRWAGLGGIIVTRSTLFNTALESGEITGMFLGADGYVYLLTQVHLYRIELVP